MNQIDLSKLPEEGHFRVLVIRTMFMDDSKEVDLIRDLGEVLKKHGFSEQHSSYNVGGHMDEVVFYPNECLEPIIPSWEYPPPEKE